MLARPHLLSPKQPVVATHLPRWLIAAILFILSLTLSLPAAATPIASPAAISGTADGNAATLIWESTGTPDPGIHPARVAVDPNGIIWVGDPYLNQFHLLDADGAYLRSWGNVGSGSGQLGSSDEEKYSENQGPAVTFDSDGNMYLADMGNGRVQKFDSNLEYLLTFEADAGMSYPMDIALGPDGNLYVCDNGLQTIFVFSPEGKLLRSFGGYGEADDQFILPVGLGVAPDGSVWVADFGTNSVKQFTAEGTLLAIHDRSGYPTGVMTSPNDVAFDANGNVFVTESFGDRVSVLDMNGAPVGWWGNRGIDVTFGLPIGIAVTPDGAILVADISMQAVFAFELAPPAA